MSDSLWPHGLYSPWNSPGQNTEVGSLSLLQGIFPTQGSNPGLPHCRQILYQLSHKGSRRILEWVAYSFSSRSSQPRNQTRVSCIAGGFFTNWAIREASTSLILEKRKSKLQWGTTSHQSEWPSLKSLQITNAGEGEEKGTLLHSQWEWKLLQSPRRTGWNFLRKLKIEFPYKRLKLKVLAKRATLIKRKSYNYSVIN